MIVTGDWRDLPQRREDDALDRGYQAHRDDAYDARRPIQEPDREKFTADYEAELNAAGWVPCTCRGCSQHGDPCAPSAYAWPEDRNPA